MSDMDSFPVTADGPASTQITSIWYERRQCPRNSRRIHSSPILTKRRACATITTAPLTAGRSMRGCATISACQLAPTRQLPLPRQRERPRQAARRPSLTTLIQAARFQAHAGLKAPTARITAPINSIAMQVPAPVPSRGPPRSPPVLMTSRHGSITPIMPPPRNTGSPTRAARQTSPATSPTKAAAGAFH